MITISLVGAQCNFWAQRCGLRVQGVLAAGLFKRVIRSPQPASKTELIETGPKASAYNLLMVRFHREFGINVTPPFIHFSQIDIPSIAEFVFSLIDLLILPLRIVLSFQLLLYQVRRLVRKFQCFSFMFVLPGWIICHGWLILLDLPCRNYFGASNSEWISQSPLSSTYTHGIDSKIHFLIYHSLQRHRDVRISRAHDIMSDIRSLRMVGW